MFREADERPGRVNGAGRVQVASSPPCESLEAAKVRIISAVCQDMSAPLRSIATHAELLAEGTDLQHPGRAMALAEAILAEAQELRTGLGDVATLAKLECHTPDSYHGLGRPQVR